MVAKKKPVKTKFHFHIGSGVAVFLIFFGLSLYESLYNKDLLGAGFWIAVGVVFLIADSIENCK